MDLNLESVNTLEDLKYFIKRVYFTEDDTKKQHHVFRMFKFPSLFKQVTSIRFSPDGESLAVGYESGNLQEISLTGHLLYTVLGRHSDLKCLRYATRAPYLFSCDGMGEVYVHSRIGQGSFRFGEGNRVCCLGVNHMRNLICGELSGALNVIDIPTGAVINAYKANPLHLNQTKYHKMQITNITLLPPNETFLTSSLDSHVKMWDKRVKYPVQQLRGPYIVGDCLDVSPRYRTILTGSYKESKCLQLWDYRTFKLIKTITPINFSDKKWGHYCQCCKFFKGDKLDRNILFKCSTYINLLDTKENRIVERCLNYVLLKNVKYFDVYEQYIAYGSDNYIIIGEYK